ncbi:MAG TPA: sugar-transfer associated ATP-grasp domain-containing protein [Candidatus Moranbacteria bacterium]|nr:sugar-transfer associated ATP-grasp domain-containing protein [Candidatus Moranbacteria bacterium]
MFGFIKKSRKILGMDARNLIYIRPFNLKSAKKIADDKLLCKKILKKNGISVPKLIAKIKTYEELENFDWSTLPDSFALKPNRGLGGEGIIVVYGKKKPARNALLGNADENTPACWIKADGSLISIEDLKAHIRNILDGSFSLSNTPDTAFFEERIRLLKLFKPYSYKGIPDIRIIVFNKVPVMAMLRLPTEASKGKANLQQGAIGVGIDLATGTTTTAVLGKNKLIEYVPGTRMLLSGIKIPYWNDILNLAVKTQEISGLGYLGVDVAIDKEDGPIILELNARPGLSIQIANLAGLKERLERVSELKIKTAKKGIRVGMDLFGGEIEEELEEISGKKVIGTVEKVKLIGKDEREIESEARIDTGAYSSSIDAELAKELGFQKTLEEFSKIDLAAYEISHEKENEIKKVFMEKYKKIIPEIEDVAVVISSSGSSIRPTIKINFILDKITIASKVNVIDRGNLKYPILIGRSDLKKFLIEIK